MRFEDEDVSIIASQLRELAAESLVVETKADIPDYAVEEIIREFVIADENRYDDLIIWIRERHDLGQNLTGYDVLDRILDAPPA